MFIYIYIIYYILYYIIYIIFYLLYIIYYCIYYTLYSIYYIPYHFNIMVRVYVFLIHHDIVWVTTKTPLFICSKRMAIRTSCEQYPGVRKPRKHSLGALRRTRPVGNSSYDIILYSITWHYMIIYDITIAWLGLIHFFNSHYSKSMVYGRGKPGATLPTIRRDRCGPCLGPGPRHRSPVGDELGWSVGPSGFVPLCYSGFAWVYKIDCWSNP